MFPSYHTVRILEEGRHVAGQALPATVCVCNVCIQQQWLWLFVGRQFAVPLVAVDGGMLRVSIAESAVGGFSGPARSQLERVGEREVELPCAPQFLFDSGYALLQGPRTVSRCLLEKVELGRLAAARQNSRGLRAAEDREPREPLG